LTGLTTNSRGSLTALTPEDRADVSARLRYDDDAGRRGMLLWRRTQVEADDSGLGSMGNSLSGSVGFGDPDEWSVDLGASWHRLDLNVDRLAFTGGTLRAGDVESSVDATAVDLRVGAPLADGLSAELLTIYTRDRGDLPVRGWDVVLGFRWELDDDVATGLRFRRRLYDEIGSDRLDYEAKILEIYLEFGF